MSPEEMDQSPSMDGQQDEVVQQSGDSNADETVPMRDVARFPFVSMLAVIALITLIALVSSYFGRSIAPPAPIHDAGLLPLGTTAPAWTLKNPEGKEHALSDYKGHLVVMDFWATWCGPCKAAMPGMQALHEKFASRGVEVLGINYLDSGDAAGYMKSKGYTYQLLLHGESIGDAYKVTAIPTVYLLDESGRILYNDVGSSPAQQKALQNVIEEHLKSKGK